MNSHTLRAVQNACGYILIGLSFLMLTLITVKTFAPDIKTEAESQTAEQTVGSYTMSMSNDSEATVTITPTSSQSIYTASNDITVTNTCSAGATITMTMSSSSSNALTRTGSDSGTKTIAATTTTRLDNYSWGYALNNTSDYHAVPLNGATAATVYDESVARTSGYNVPVTFGVKTDDSLPSGTYTGDVIYTMAPKAGCLSYGVTWDFDGGTAKSGATYPTSLGWDDTVDLSALTPTRDGYTFAGWTNGTLDFAGTETAADLNSADSIAVTVKSKWCKTTTDFDYIGGEQTFTADCSGYYKLEVWGAQGGDTVYGGYGSYSIGLTEITAGSMAYIVVGGQGSNSLYIAGGYNGGGSTASVDVSAYTSRRDYGGGGATHIALDSGLLQNLSSHKADGRILIVAGGGGGGKGSEVIEYRYGGNAGGIRGNDASNDNSGDDNNNAVGRGATQDDGGSSAISRNSQCITDKGGFGYGSDGCSYNRTNGISGGGGSGWYGGSGGAQHTKDGAGGGGSGYIGSSNLISGASITKHMTCYSCTTSSDANTQTYSNTNVSATATADYSKTGNGYARITWIGTNI